MIIFTFVNIIIITKILFPLSFTDSKWKKLNHLFSFYVIDEKQFLFELKIINYRHAHRKKYVRSIIDNFRKADNLRKVK